MSQDVNRRYEGTVVRKAQIARAAAEIIVRHGSEHVTIKALANEIGLSEAAIYRHFCSKSEIYRYLIRIIRTTLLSGLGVNKGELTFKYLETMMFKHVDAIEKSSAVEFQAIAEIISIGDRCLYSDMLDTVNSYIEDVANIIQQGKNAGFVKKEVDPIQAAVLWYCFINGLANLWVLNKHSFKLSQRFHKLWPVYRDSVFLLS